MITLLLCSKFFSGSPLFSVWNLNSCSWVTISLTLYSDVQWYKSPLFPRTDLILLTMPPPCWVTGAAELKLIHSSELSGVKKIFFFRQSLIQVWMTPYFRLVYPSHSHFQDSIWIYRNLMWISWHLGKGSLSHVVLGVVSVGIYWNVVGLVYLN